MRILEVAAVFIVGLGIGSVAFDMIEKRRKPPAPVRAVAPGELYPIPAERAFAMLMAVPVADPVRQQTGAPVITTSAKDKGQIMWVAYLTGQELGNLTVGLKSEGPEATRVVTHFRLSGSALLSEAGVKDPRLVRNLQKFGQLVLSDHVGAILRSEALNRPPDVEAARFAFSPEEMNEIQRTIAGIEGALAQRRQSAENAAILAEQADRIARMEELAASRRAAMMASRAAQAARTRPTYPSPVYRRPVYRRPTYPGPNY
jgi:hypothetical protein